LGGGKERVLPKTKPNLCKRTRVRRARAQEQLAARRREKEERCPAKSVQRETYGHRKGRKAIEKTGATRKELGEAMKKKKTKEEGGKERDSD